jgi:hypothetical protein
MVALVHPASQLPQTSLSWQACQHASIKQKDAQQVYYIPEIPTTTGKIHLITKGKQLLDSVYSGKMTNLRQTRGLNGS